MATRKKHKFKAKNENGKNATKPIIYTRKYVHRELKDMLRKLRDDEEVAGGHHIYYKLQLFINKPYSSNRFTEWCEKYKDDPKISVTIDKIEDILSSRAWVGGLKGVLNASMCKFHLINNYGAREVEKVEVSGRIENTILMRSIIKKSSEAGDAGDKLEEKVS